MNCGRALLLPMALAASFAAADSIVLNGERIDGVYIVESSRAVYVCNPADGTAQSIAKTNPALGEVTITPDEAAREALRAEYETHKTEREQERLGISNQPADADVQIHFALGDAPIDPLPRSRSTTPVLRLKGERGSASRIGMPEFVGTNSARSTPGVGQGAGGGGFSGGGASRASGGSGGARGGGGNGQGNAFGFRNISELFDSTNDAAVGETPNPITSR